MNPKRQGRRKGSVGIEFVLVVGLFYVPLLIGTLVIGLSLIRSTQVVQLTRDAGHMWGQGINFSSNEPKNRQLVLRLANGLNITDTAGNGVVIFSQIKRIGLADCTSCTNLNHYVVTRRLTIGAASLRTSNYGNPATIDANGDIVNYLNDTTAQADSFSALMPLDPGETAFPTEAFFAASDYSWGSVLRASGIYTFSVF